MKRQMICKKDRTKKTGLRVIACAMASALLLSSVPIVQVNASASQTTSSSESDDDWVDTFEGWDDDAIENTYVAYQITDWLSLEDKLITKGNDIGVNVTATKLSKKVTALKDTIQSVVKANGGAANADYYTQIMLAIAQVFADKSASNDPFMWQTYMDPTYSDSGLMSKEKSIELAFKRLKKMETTYGVRYNESPAITSQDGKYDVILAGYMVGDGYINKNNKYTKKNVQQYISENQDKFLVTKSDGTTVNIVPISNFPDLVNSHLNVTSISGSGAGDYGKGGMSVPVLYQRKYSNVSWGDNNNIMYAGCGVVSLAMVLSYLTGRSISVEELARKYDKDTYRLPGGATKGPSLFKKAASDYGFDYMHTRNINTVRKALLQGIPVLCSQNPGLFTSKRHYIVLRGISNDSNIEDVKVWVNDPNGHANGKRHGYSESGWLNRTFRLKADVHRTLNSGYYILSKKGTFNP